MKREKYETCNFCQRIIVLPSVELFPDKKRTGEVNSLLSLSSENGGLLKFLQQSSKLISAKLLSNELVERPLYAAEQYNNMQDRIDIALPKV